MDVIQCQNVVQQQAQGSINQNGQLPTENVGGHSERLREVHDRGNAMCAKLMEEYEVKRRKYKAVANTRYIR